MRAFYKLCAAVLIVFVILAAVMNVCIVREKRSSDGIYRVEAKRLADDINDTGSYDLEDYPHLTGVFTAKDGELYASDKHYLIVEAEGGPYRVEYSISKSNGRIILIVDCVLFAVLLIIIALLMYIRKHIILPFGRLRNVPKELAKGNLAVPIPEEKSRFFGKFTWGVNLLRESIEDSRKKEITMQREKKLLLLSLSHDIKTPLSAIKLNAKALARGLYKDEEKRREAAESINVRADEIESFVGQITKAASEDFMTFETVKGEVYLSQLISKITERYSAQLSMKGTEFRVQEYADCILSCDPDRLGECLQNLVENAMKYGDGRLIGLDFDTLDGCQLITVYNTGCTLEKKELPQIFESFHRGSNADNVQGNGLGLSIAKSFTEACGGTFEIIIDGDMFTAHVKLPLIRQ